MKRLGNKWEKWGEKEIERVVRCRICGQMFEFEGLPPPACSVCMMAREEQYQIVRALVREYPGITALDVHEITEVPMNVILKYINKGLLEVVATRDDDGEISERVGYMIKHVKERAKIILQHRTENNRVDELNDEESAIMERKNRSKFTWLGE